MTSTTMEEATSVLHCSSFNWLHSNLWLAGKELDARGKKADPAALADVSGLGESGEMSWLQLDVVAAGIMHRRAGELQQAGPSCLLAAKPKQLLHPPCSIRQRFKLPPPFLPLLSSHPAC